MAIFVQKYKHLHFFANCTQWILFFNILFLLLVVIYPSFQSIVTPDALAGDAYEASKERFAGLWGNPNMAGYVCVVVIILSTWATRWVAWVGRISGVAIIYFSASRKAALLLTIIFLMNILIVQRRNIKAWLLVGAGALIVVVPFLFDNRVMGSSVSRLANDQKLSRMVDLSESQSGDDESRVALLKHWIPIVSAAPWYGYGLGSMAGYDSQGRIPRKELFITGTHNTYLGIWVDVGPIGLIAFLGVFSIYIYRYLVSSFSPTTRWALLSLMVCNILILTVSHNHLFCAEGIMAFSLFFLLPTSPALMGEEAWEASA